MLEGLETWGSALASWIGTVLLHATVLLAPVLLIQQRLRSLAAREVLLKGALFGGLVTGTIALGWGGGWALVDSASVVFAPRVETGPVALAVPPGILADGALASGSQPDSGAPAVPWPALAAALWLALVTARLTRLAVRRRGALRGLADRTRIRDAALLRRARRLGGRGVVLTEHHGLGTPIALGEREVGEPLEVPGGFRVIAVLERAQASPPSFGEVREEVVALRRRSVGERALTRYVAALRAKARIEVHGR